MPVKNKPARSAVPASSMPAGAVVPIPADRLPPLVNLKPKDLASALADIEVIIPPEKLAVPAPVTLDLRSPYNAYVGALEFMGVPYINASQTNVSFPGNRQLFSGQNVEKLGVWLRSGKLVVLDYMVQSKKAGTTFHLTLVEDETEHIEATGQIQHIVRAFDARQMGSGYFCQLALTHNANKRTRFGEPRPFEFFSCRVSTLE